MIIRFFSLFLLTLFCIHGTTGQIWIPTSSYELTEGDHIRDVSFYEKDVIWVAANTQLDTEPTTWVNSIYFSVDRGLSWEKIIVPGLDTFRFENIHALDDNKAFVAARNSKHDFFGTLLYTEDRGQNWEEIYSDNSVGSTLHFYDDNRVLLLNSTYASKSYDGGFTWESFEINPPIGTIPFKESLNISNINSHAFVNDYGFIGGDDSKVKRLMLFNPLPFNPGFTDENFNVSSVSFKDENNGLMVMRPKTDFQTIPVEIARTLNGGVNWEVLSTPDLFINHIAYVPNTAGSFVGTVFGPSSLAKSMTVFTNDFGETWTIDDNDGVFCHNAFAGIVFFSAAEGYAFNQAAEENCVEPVMYYWNSDDLISSLNETVAEDNSKIYPNPTNGKINLEFDFVPNRISFYNSVGSLLSNHTDLSKNNVIDVINYPKGVLTIVIETESNLIIRRVVKL